MPTSAFIIHTYPSYYYIITSFIGTCNKIHTFQWLKKEKYALKIVKIIFTVKEEPFNTYWQGGL